MAKWKIKILKDRTVEGLERQMEEHSDDGWEPCNTVYTGIEFHLLIRRERVGWDSFVPTDIHSEDDVCLGKALRGLRKESTGYGTPAYEFCNDKQLWDIVRKKPTTVLHLKNICDNSRMLLHAAEVLQLVRDKGVVRDPHRPIGGHTHEEYKVGEEEKKSSEVGTPPYGDGNVPF